MVQMIGLSALGRDAVDVDAGQKHFAGLRDHRGLLAHLAGGGGAGRIVVGLHVAAGGQPTVQPLMVDEEETFAVGVQGAGELPIDLADRLGDFLRVLRTALR